MFTYEYMLTYQYLLITTLSLLHRIGMQPTLPHMLITLHLFLSKFFRAQASPRHAGQLWRAERSHRPDCGQQDTQVHAAGRCWDQTDTDLFPELCDVGNQEEEEEDEEEAEERAMYYEKVLLAVQRWFGAQGWPTGPNNIRIPQSMRV